MNYDLAYDNLFLERVKKKSIINEKGCWLLSSSLTPSGYSMLSYKGNTIRGHKIVFEITNGKVPFGKVLDHYYCQNRNCVNPQHLEIVSQQENIKRGLTGITWKQKTYCPKGHPYNAENTSYRKNGSRRCNSCTKTWNKNTKNYRKEWNLKNQNRIKQYRLDWERNNKDKVHEYYLKQQMKRKIQ